MNELSIKLISIISGFLLAYLLYDSCKDGICFKKGS